MNRDTLLALLSSKGVFSEKLPGFESREGQQKMLEDVLSAYEEEQIALVEAGTGTGKSLAYLLPALFWAIKKGERTVIATHTIALQEQLMHKDIPFLLKTLNLDVKVELMKGMHNYVCLRKVQDHAHEVPESLVRWTKTAKEGSRSELPIFPSHDLWEQVRAESEGCTHIKCPHYKECFFFKARKKAADAKLIVANHHLLFADLRVRQEKENYTDICIMPPFQRLILDEAHHVEDVATDYFADRVSRRGLIHLLGRLLSDRGTGKIASLRKVLFDVANRELMDLLELSLPVEKRKCVELIQHTFDRIQEFVGEEQGEDKLRFRKNHLESPFWTTSVQPAVRELVEQTKRFIQSALLLEGLVKRLEDPAILAKCEGNLADIGGICHRLELALETLVNFVFTPLEVTRVRWIEGEGHLVAADLEIAPRLSEALFTPLLTTVLTSATLSTNNAFSFIRSRLGIQEAVEKIYDSPFDYGSQAMLSVPLDLPDPNSPQFVQAASKSILHAIESSEGGVFVLFTSYQMLRTCREILAETLSQRDFTLFCQGEEGRSTLLQKFRDRKRAVLFGTDSFWEGVDVVGEALRCVILVKLPFKVPSDPLFQARSEAITEQGGSPFFDYSLPHAIVKFKQGFGRLIRNKEDRGCVICLDSRLVKKGYGKQFIKSLPPCPHHFEPSAALLERWHLFYQSSKKKFDVK